MEGWYPFWGLHNVKPKCLVLKTFSLAEELVMTIARGAACLFLAGDPDDRA